MYLGKPKGATFRIISAALIFFFMASFVMPKDALAARSRAGGGDVPEFSFSDFATTAGIGVGTAVVGASIGGALGSVWDGVKGGLDAATIASNMGSAFTSGFSSLPSFTTTMISGYNTFMSGTQVVRAVSAAGAYHGWNPATTFILSSVASGVTAGALNPGSALGGAVPAIGGSGILEGAFIGGLGGLANSEVQVLIARDRISEGKNPGVGAQIAGFTAGYLATNFGRNLFDARTYEPDTKGDTNIAKNIIIKPATDTLNAWPLLATNALGTWAASRVDESYSQMIRVGIDSVGGQVLDAFADSYSLKPSLWEEGAKTPLSFKDELGKRFNSGTVKYVILSNLLSGGISAAANALIGNPDKNTGKYSDQTRSMLLSLAGVAGSSIARGVALNIYSENNPEIAVQNGLKIPDMGTTIGQSLGQGLFELGAQSMAMNLPYEPGGLSTSAWVHYSQNLFYSSRAAAAVGFWQIMGNNVINTGKDIINRNALATVADTSLGRFMGMAPFLAVEGYNKMPFSIVTVYKNPAGVDSPDFSKTWPVWKIEPNPLDKSWKDIQQKARRDIGK